MRFIILTLLFTFSLVADDEAKQRKVLLSLAGAWSGTGNTVSINSSGKEFPSKAEQKALGELIFNEKALFRRIYLKRVIPERDDRLYNSFIITFWLDFKNKYRSTTYDSKGLVYHKDFTMDEKGSCKVYSKIDGKFILTGKSKITKELFVGSSEYESGGYLRKSKFEFKKVKEVKFEDSEVKLEPAIKKVLDSLPGKFPLSGHFKLHEEKEKLSIYGYETKQKTFMKWEIHTDGNYKVFKGKGFLDEKKGYWKQVE